MLFCIIHSLYCPRSLCFPFYVTICFYFTRKIHFIHINVILCFAPICVLASFLLKSSPSPTAIFPFDACYWCCCLLMIACTLKTVHSSTDATTLQTCFLHMHNKHPYDFHYSIYGFSVADIRKHLYQYQKHAEIGEKAKLKKLNKQCIKLKSIKYRRACAVMTPNIRSMYNVWNSEHLQSRELCTFFAILFWMSCPAITWMFMNGEIVLLIDSKLACNIPTIKHSNHPRQEQTYDILKLRPIITIQHLCMRNFAYAAFCTAR